MSHYVTLPSNGADLLSDYGLIHNTQSDFETDLKYPLNFNYSQYEVGLSEISYRKLWLVTLGSFKIIDNVRNIVMHERRIEVLDGISIPKVINILNQHLNDYTPGDTNPLINNQYKKIHFTLVNKEELLINVPLGITLEITGYFTSLLRHRSSTPMHYGVTWMELEKDKLMFAQNNITQENDHITIQGHETLNTKCFIVNSNIRCIENLYLYTDIINEVHVGSDMLKLLKVIPVRANFDEVASETFYFPHYISLDSRYIDRIRMKIRDSQGNKIRFSAEHSQIVYKLHFKPIEHYK